MAAVIATWAFGLPVVMKGSSLLQKGKSSLDTIEDILTECERDPDTGRYYIGKGGLPNSEGVVQCDAALMCNGNYGAVAGIEGCPCPTKVARKVLENPHMCLLVGTGANIFAEKEGINLVPNHEMLTEDGMNKYEEWKKLQQTPPGHDTLGAIALDDTGTLTVGVTTSGLPFKTPGRVGDSPIIGSGLYADNDVGAACATGDGDQIIKYCPSYRTVQLMSQGLTPNDACKEVIREIRHKHGLERPMFEMGIIALNIKGDHGAAGTVKNWTDVGTMKIYNGFPYSAWNNNDTKQPTVIVVPET